MEFCNICLEQFTIENIVKPCKQSDKHIFCKSCFEEWISTFQKNDQNVNYNFLDEEYENSSNTPSCPVCRCTIAITNSNCEIYDDTGNMISIKDYVMNKSSTYFLVKKYNISKENGRNIKYEFYISPFSIKNQLHYSKSLLNSPETSTEDYDVQFSLNIFNKPFVILHGLFIEYYDKVGENRNIKFRKNMKDNYHHGLYESFYEDGTPKVVCNYDYNQLHGSYISYYGNGSIDIKTHFDNNNVVGDYESYYDDGVLKVKSFYVIDLDRTNNCNSAILIGKNIHSFLDKVYICYDKKKYNESNDKYYLSSYVIYKDTKIIKIYIFTYSILYKNYIYLSSYYELNKISNLYTKFVYNQDNFLIKNYTFYYDENNISKYEGIYIEYKMDRNKIYRKNVKIYQKGNILEEKLYDNENNLISSHVFDYTKMIVHSRKYMNNKIVYIFSFKFTNSLTCFNKCNVINGIEKKYNNNGILTCIKYHYTNFNVVKNYIEYSNKAFLNTIEYISNHYSKKITYYLCTNIVKKEEVTINQRLIYENEYHENGNRKYKITTEIFNEYDFKNDSNNISNEIKMKCIFKYDEKNIFLGIDYVLNNDKIILHKATNTLNGSYKIFNTFIKDKRIFTKVQFKNNKLHGKYICYSYNKPIIVNKYKNNKLHGLCKSYSYVNNKKYIKSMIMYKDGLKNGVSKSYYDDGKVHIKSYYTNDLLYGKYIEYNEEGKIVKEEFYYENNLLTGISKITYKNGVYFSNHINGKLHGTTDFCGNNDIIEKKYFENNIPIGIHTIEDEKEKVTHVTCDYTTSEEEIGKFMDIEDIDFNKFIYSIVTRYCIDSNKDVKVTFLRLISKNSNQMFIHGLVTFYNNENDTIIAEIQYNMDNISGTFDIYHMNGKKCIHTFVKNNNVLKHFDYFENDNLIPTMSFSEEKDLIEMNKFIDFNQFVFLNNYEYNYMKTMLDKTVLSPFDIYDDYYQSNVNNDDYDHDYYDQDDSYSYDSYGSYGSYD